MNHMIDFIILTIYLVGLFLIPIWQKKKQKKGWIFYELIWAGMIFFLYSIYLDVHQSTAYFLLPTVGFACFSFFYFREKRRLINGLLFNVFLGSFLFYLTILALSTKSPIHLMVLGLLFIALIALLLFGVYALLIFLYWNAVVVLKKEGRSLANLLSLLLAIGLTIFLIANHFSTRILPAWAMPIFSILPSLLFYFFVVFYNFLTASTLYQFNRPKYNQDFIIVLGSGLIDGKRVPPLLGNRIDRAIKFYKAQARATLKPPKIIMSGGKGDDEHLAESIAMKEYACQLGIPEDHILIEANSKNTLENMLFSKEIMEQNATNKEYEVIFTTNNFHLFRAGLFAKMAHLKAEGIGAKTAFYFLPNAFLREYIAILVLHKRRHTIFCSLIILFMIFLSIMELVFSNLHL